MSNAARDALLAKISDDELLTRLVEAERRVKSERTTRRDYARRAVTGGTIAGRDVTRRDLDRAARSVSRWDDAYASLLAEFNRRAS